MAKYPWVYVDVDTQFDFMNPRGALYIKGAEKLVPILQRLFERALAKNIPVISSADCHEPDDPEFEKFPPHCVRDTEGQKKLSCTLLANRCIVEPTDDLEDPLELLGKHQQLVFRKKALDLFSNPNARRLFERLDCGRCVVFGVATDYCVAAAVKGSFQRLQFTPDLLPADLIGTMIYDEREHTFYAKKGPVFSNLILADEINRAPAKVQSALLEAMQERQVTIGDETFKLDTPFLVMATQNPIEQEGTYPLPEAQVDRFMLKLKVDYPDPDEELAILQRCTTGEELSARPVATVDELVAGRELLYRLYMDEKVQRYIVDLVVATREPAEYGLGALVPLIEYGASPRATLCLVAAGRAHAFLRGRGFVTPEDIKAVGADAMRHRLVLSFEAEAESVTPDEIIQRVFDAVEVP